MRGLPGRPGARGNPRTRQEEPVRPWGTRRRGGRHRGGAVHRDLDQHRSVADDRPRARRLYLTDSGSLTAAELTRHLQVSPASVSKAIGELEQQEMVRRERDPRRRRDRYIIDADALFRAWMAAARQNALLADFAHRAAETLGAASPAGGCGTSATSSTTSARRCCRRPSSGARPTTPSKSCERPVRRHRML
ncbi:MarR family transcriptional regulator [Streptosporangium lutulentum]